jgi:putative flippase GtrA
MIQKLVSKRMLRFVVIGVCNAAISFGILNLSFYRLHQTKIISSIIATSCALVFSFIMNRGFVFDDKTKKVHEQLPVFVVVTISGSLLVLNLVYILSLKLLNGHEHLIIEPVKSLTSVSLTKNFVDINLSTVVGAIVALFWNYNGYKRFVFRGSKDAIEEAIEHTP